ncbi:hypothetical protein [Nonomuraea soli]|uniref:Cellobiose-specific phosphotransferase system component IIC n=1 Tax=Nonomuraea soli TaxID=1032476 RepID=A0A7W0CF60_9ACTN|nr:hypothetical protein [Nonomuraea soli]MBA2890013.1 cellobiose-specific phosphotransferase system component IIC [Nonomuraea soli]
METFRRAGAAVVWTAMWVGCAVITRGDADAFGAMIPLLAAGSLLVLLSYAHRAAVAGYVVSSLSATAAVLAGTLLVLGDTPYLVPMVWLLGVGGLSTAALAPVYWTIRTTRRGSAHRRTGRPRR